MFKSKTNGKYRTQGKNGNGNHLDTELPFQMDMNGKSSANMPVYRESKHYSLDAKIALDNGAVCISPDASENEFYKVLRTQIQHRTKEKGWNTIMITSAHPGEGKTLTSINLAITFAKEIDRTVLLVDGDLRKQDVRRYLNIKNNGGLIDYLVADRPLQDIIIWPGIDKFTLISGGRTVRDSSELLGSPMMKNLALDLKNRYSDRYVLFDVPPVFAGADAMVFAPLVDGFIMIVEAGKTTLSDIRRALAMLPEEKFLGFVFNRQKRSLMNYGDYYY